MIIKLEFISSGCRNSINFKIQMNPRIQVKRKHNSQVRGIVVDRTPIDINIIGREGFKEFNQTQTIQILSTTF